MMAIIVDIWMIPFAQDSRSSGSISGKMPYLAGPNMADWLAIRNMTTQRSIGSCRKKPSAPSAMTATSRYLVQTATRFLLNRSDKDPKNPGNTMNGTARTTPATAMMNPRSEFVPASDAYAASANTMTSLYRLSLNAPWNWVTTSDQKPRAW
ncbi:MAG: hypothetical protein KJ060_12385 [Candidatus Hydrogenedentes bacterium]|nr:hypothetical protein [Candidatus Hydrogenedentota bacterium]